MRLNLLLILFISGCASQTLINRDINWRAVPLSSAYPVQPSGLCMVDGTLFTVSDKHDWIYSVIVHEDTAELKPHIRIDKQALGVDSLDLEGIASDGQGNFYLVSEQHARIIKVNAKGSRWLPGIDLSLAAQKVGLLRKPNAGFEGISLSHNQQLIVMAEREPRGILEIDLSPNKTHIDNVRAYLLNLSIYDYPSSRSVDFSGADYFRDELYVLQRNANLITRMNRRIDSYREGEVAWSFADLVDAPEFAYENMAYGHAEGLVVTEKAFYVILDNNYSPRKTNGNDSRPLLLIGQR